MLSNDPLRKVIRGLRRRIRAWFGRPEPARTPKPRRGSRRRIAVAPIPAVAKPTPPEPATPPTAAKRAAIARRRAARRAASPPTLLRRSSPRLERPWSLLLLGGSNSVLKGGLADATFACLTDRLGPPLRLENRAVGGNTTLHGLILAKRAQDLADFDTLVVEYGINDTSLSRNGRDVWAGGAEGLLRHALTVRPDMRVVYVLLGKRAVSSPDLLRCAEMLVDLVAHYGQTHSVSLVDVDHVLRGVLFTSQRELNSFYQDVSHLSPRRAARLLAPFVASEIANAPRRPGGALPPPLHPWHFQDAVALDLAGENPDRVFSNARFVAPTRRIGLGERVTLEIPGRIACVEYIACGEGATLRVEEAGEAPFALHTRHSLTASGEFSFLIRSEPLRARDWETGARGPRTVTLGATRDAPADELIPAYNMVVAPPDAGQAVYLRSLLCVP